jgi:hypothetical protein
MSVSLIKDSDIHDLIEVGEHTEIIREPLSEAAFAQLKFSLVEELRTDLLAEDNDKLAEVDKLMLQARGLFMGFAPSDGHLNISLRNTPAMLWVLDNIWPTERDDLMFFLHDIRGLTMACAMVASFENDTATMEAVSLSMDLVGRILAHKYVDEEIDMSTMLEIFNIFNI